MKKDHIGMLSQRLVQFKNNKKVLNQFKNSKIVNLKTTKNAPLKKELREKGWYWNAVSEVGSI